jgi:hypothetical protein
LNQNRHFLTVRAFAYFILQTLLQIDHPAIESGRSELAATTDERFERDAVKGGISVGDWLLPPELTFGVRLLFFVLVFFLLHISSLQVEQTTETIPHPSRIGLGKAFLHIRQPISFGNLSP